MFDETKPDDLVTNMPLQPATPTVTRLSDGSPDAARYRAILQRQIDEGAKRAADVITTIERDQPRDQIVRARAAGFDVAPHSAFASASPTIGTSRPTSRSGRSPDAPACRFRTCASSPRPNRLRGSINSPPRSSASTTATRAMCACSYAVSGASCADGSATSTADSIHVHSSMPSRAKRAAWERSLSTA
jgi:hypothetical protein